MFGSKEGASIEDIAAMDGDISISTKTAQRHSTACSRSQLNRAFSLAQLPAITPSKVPATGVGWGGGLSVGSLNRDPAMHDEESGIRGSVSEPDDRPIF